MEVIFTDGSAKNNGSKTATGGIGVYFPNRLEWNYSEQVTYNTFKTKVTNNLTELYAIIKAISIATSHDISTFTIYTDSQYCYNSFTKWAKTGEKNNWKKKDGKPILNQEFVKDIYDATKKYKITFCHCNSHRNEPSCKESEEYKIWYGNMMADHLANVTI